MIHVTPAEAGATRADAASEHVSNAALVARARRGETAAFEQLVRRYSGPVYRIALRVIGDAAAAHDVAQEAFVTTWRRLPQLREGQSFAAWLYRITTTGALMAARARRHDVGLEEAGLPPTTAPGPEQQAIAADLRTALLRALGQLPVEQRACWVLRELEGLSYDQIADVTEATPQAVRGRIHRARRRLAEKLAPWR